MRPIRSPLSRLFALALVLLPIAACDDEPVQPSPALTTVTVSLSLGTITVGQTATAAAAGLDQNGAPFAIGTVTWSTSNAAVATVTQSGEVKGAGAGTADVLATVGTTTGKATLTVNAPAAIKINEIESNGGTPGDWSELYNPTSAAVDLSGWVVKDNDDTHAYVIPAGTSIPAGGYLTTEESGYGFGLGAPDAVRLYNRFGVLVDSYEWTAHAATTYGRCPTGTGAFVTTGAPTKNAANDCRVAVRINEVESNGGVPGDWIELINTGSAAVSLSGYVVKDNDDTHSTPFSSGTTIAAGGFLVVEEATMGYGLGAADAARLFDPQGTLVDSYEWTAHAATTYGRCPDGSGAFATTGNASTKGAANDCSSGGGGGGGAALAWPGSDNVTTVDAVNQWTSNLSGLTYEGAAGSSPAVLWAVLNGPGTLYRLLNTGGTWTPDPANGWSAGKALRYPNGTGNPDSEGVTFTAASSGGIYVATERNNDASTVSKNAILRFDASIGTAATLAATHEWDITADLPAVGANLGIEAITWVPDSFLTSKSFFDETAGHTYVPSEYADHGTGLFFVGVEGNGGIYAYALNHTNNTARRVATIVTGFPGVMGEEFDRDLGYLWAICDDGCNNQAAVLEIDTRAASATRGRWVVNRKLDRPSSMPNINNEGFAIAPASECAGNVKPVFWSDDNNTSTHSLRRAGIPCGAFSALAAPSNPWNPVP